MEIPCKDIALSIERALRTRVESLPTVPKLLTILLGESSEQRSFVSIKEQLAGKLGVKFEFLHFTDIPLLNDFLTLIKQKVADPAITGIIIQHPFPPEYDAQKIYDIITPEKDIEGHKTGSKFIFPLSLAVLTGIKYVYGGLHTDESVLVEFEKDRSFFQDVLKDKQIVIAGRGITGGKPIAEAFKRLDVNFTQTHSQTSEAEKLYQTADIIITATGKKIITPDIIKEGIVLLNVGLRKEKGNLRGDYDEEEIREKAAFYTPTPQGLGPIDVLYLYKNLIDSANNSL